MSKVKARDLRCGTVVMWRPSFDGSRLPYEAVVVKVERLADLVGLLQAQIANAKSRQIMREAAENLIDVVDSLDVYGREARRVTFEHGAIDMKSSREFEWRGQRA